MKEKSRRLYLYAITIIVGLCLTSCSQRSQQNSTNWEALRDSGIQQYQEGKYAKAECSFKTALEELNRRGATDANRFSIQQLLASSLHQQKKLEEAKDNFEAALDILNKNEDAPVRLQGTVINQLGQVYSEMGDYEKAESNYEKALAIFRKDGVPADIARIMIDIAVLRLDQKRYEEAEKLLESAIEMAENDEGTDQRQLATALDCLASVYKYQGKYDDAESFYHRSLHTWKEVSGKKHPDVAVTMANLSRFYYERGMYLKAHDTMSEALDIAERTLEPKDQQLAHYMWRAAQIDLKLEDYKTAEARIKRALKINDECLKPDDPKLADVLKTYAEILCKTNRKAEAVQIDKRVKQILSKTR